MAAPKRRRRLPPAPEPIRVVGPVLLTIHEVADLLRCSPQTVRRMVKRGELERARRDGPKSGSRMLILASSVDALIRGAS